MENPTTAVFVLIAYPSLWHVHYSVSVHCKKTSLSIEVSQCINICQCCHFCYWIRFYSPPFPLVWRLLQSRFLHMPFKLSLVFNVQKRPMRGPAISSFALDLLKKVSIPHDQSDRTSVTRWSQSDGSI